jgi:hypothetical protein
MELRVLLAVAALDLYAIAVSRLPKLPFHWKPFLGGTEKKDKPPTLRFSALLTEGGAQRLELMSS